MPDTEPSRQVYVNIYGGLGNQLFQAAVGYIVAALAGAQLNFITDNFKDEELRRFLLPAFPYLRGRVVPSEDVQGIAMIHEEALQGMEPQTLMVQLAAFAKGNGKLFLSGFWHDEAYFIQWRDMLRLALRPAISQSVQQQAQQIQGTEAIGIHQRRVGYGYMGLAKSDYYLDAITQIRHEKGNLPIYVFSDDPYYSRYLFRQLDNVHFPGDSNLESPLHDFHLLSACRHHVMANSTFSWWAAWLAEQEDSILYTPQPWNVDYPHIAPAPSRWRRIENATQRS